MNFLFNTKEPWENLNENQTILFEKIMNKIRRPTDEKDTPLIKRRLVRCILEAETPFLAAGAKLIIPIMIENINSFLINLNFDAKSYTYLATIYTKLKNGNGLIPIGELNDKYFDEVINFLSGKIGSYRKLFENYNNLSRLELKGHKFNSHNIFELLKLLICIDFGNHDMTVVIGVDTTKITVEKMQEMKSFVEEINELKKKKLIVEFFDDINRKELDINEEKMNEAEKMNEEEEINEKKDDSVDSKLKEFKLTEEEMKKLFVTQAMGQRIETGKPLIKKLINKGEKITREIMRAEQEKSRRGGRYKRKTKRKSKRKHSYTYRKKKYSF